MRTLDPQSTVANVSYRETQFNLSRMPCHPEMAFGVSLYPVRKAGGNPDLTQTRADPGWLSDPLVLVIPHTGWQALTRNL